MDETLEGRIETLERAVTDGDHDLSTLAEEAEALDRLAAVEERVDELESQVEELDAATQALRGYVGNIRSVNSDVEQRADAALAKAEAVEDAVTDAEQTVTTNGNAGAAGNWTGDNTAGDRAVDGHRDGSSHRSGQHAVGRERDTGTGSERGREAVGAPTGPAHDAGATERRRRGTDGPPVDERTDRKHCHACGRLHGTGGPESDETPGTTGPASGSETLVESGEEEPGTLERIRELL